MAFYWFSRDEGNSYIYSDFVNLSIHFQGARKADIKKAYKKLSLTEHPDKGGDEKKFVKINKGNFPE